MANLHTSTYNYTSKPQGAWNFITTLRPVAINLKSVSKQMPGQTSGEFQWITSSNNDASKINFKSQGKVDVSSYFLDDHWQREICARAIFSHMDHQVIPGTYQALAVFLKIYVKVSQNKLPLLKRIASSSSTSVLTPSRFNSFAITNNYEASNRSDVF